MKYLISLFLIFLLVGCESDIKDLELIEEEPISCTITSGESKVKETEIIDKSFSLCSDVSAFNYNQDFKTKDDYKDYLINNNFKYAIIRMGGRGYGKAGNMYYDSKVDFYIDALEELKMPYGFYFLDEALNIEEINAEYKYIKDFLDERSLEYNLLPLFIDMEYQHGDGRADDCWEDRVFLVNALIDKFKEDEIEIIVYANGARIETYLKDLNCMYWTAMYPEDNNIPKTSYKDYIIEEMRKIDSGEVIAEESILSTKINKGGTETITYSNDYLDKVVGWQFTESGASNDGINGNFDLSIMDDDYFKRFIK